MSTIKKLLIFITILAPMAMGCSSTENRIATTVELENDEYPMTIGEDYDAFKVANFVKKRTELARRLWEQERLDDCIMVLQALVKNIPSSIRNRYDLGMMYFQRASPSIKKHNQLSQQLSKLAKDEQKDSAEVLQRELAGVYKILQGDCQRALDQFTIFSRNMPQDPRPVDMMWRCQWALEMYVDASDNLQRMINWEGVLEDNQRNDYLKIQKILREYILQTGQRNRRGLRSPDRINPPR
ncbi:MAG: hypothetical protein P1V97_06995 [Planctomycetota bacterium]|nr:hypothetical protein [Planctomycetota bacterium]